MLVLPPSYKPEYIDGWLNTNEGFFVKRILETCIDIKSEEGNVKRIEGGKKHCDRCYKALEAIPDYDNYCTLFHWSYADVKAILFDNDSKKYKCLSWEQTNNDFDEAIKEVGELYKNTKFKTILILIKGSYPIKPLEYSCLENLINRIHDYIMDEETMFFQVIHKEYEKPVLSIVYF